MIDFLRGTVAHREADYAVIDVHGVGYRVFCPNPFALPDKAEGTTVYIHHHVREDAILLFGFGSREEQSLFRRLIDVTGIGPKVALGILSGGRPEAVVSAIQQENVPFLMKLPGIGKKTAQRIILDLKDKLGAVTSGFDGALLTAAMQEAALPSSAGGGAWAEAKEALLSLGYTEAEADRAWVSVKPKSKEDDSADVLIKLALQALYAG
ncbi:Holliday junction branch migration protein RuvA [Paenibacillus hodogayensis]|uniref:Holliday junction branch migration complex subunit RuvA n=1 Tax=Paenibacillus hodogayensis TaxID=279208 RepID=A0ABV5VWR6_9BACL